MGNSIDTDRVRVTLTSFLAYFTMSAVITPLGVVSQSMAAHFDIEVTTATALFSYLTTGILGGTFLSVFVYSLLSIRHINVLAGSLLAASLFGLGWVDQFWLVPVFFAIVGICCGLLLAAAVIVLTKTYTEHSRARALLLTDSFYSAAGVAAGFAAGRLIGSGLHWGNSYTIAIVASALLVVVAATSKYPDVEPEPQIETGQDSRDRWPITVFVLGLALLIYILGFIFIYSWVPVYASETFAADSELGGMLVSRFFLGLFLGQLATFGLSYKLDLRVLLGGLLLSSIVATIGLWNSTGLGMIATTMLILGFLSGGILKTLLTYGTMQVRAPSTRMISFLVLCTAIGSSIGPALSAVIVDSWGTKAVLIAVTIGYIITTMLVFGTMNVDKLTENVRRKNNV